MHDPAIRVLCGVMLMTLFTGACSTTASVPTAATAPSTQSVEVHAPPITETAARRASATAFIPGATSTPVPSAVPTVESLKATVTADLLSCRYGPGAEYLYLYGLRRGANIVLVGRSNGDNWHWVYVEGRSPCWVNATFLDIQGDWSALPVVYPGKARLPVSPYYPPTTVLSAVRHGDQVTVEWLDIPLRAGDQEDASMQHYVVETWRCESGRILFEPLATNELTVTFTDQPGCTAASHGRIFVQEKHGFAGPAEIPWPAP